MNINNIDEFTKELSHIAFFNRLEVFTYLQSRNITVIDLKKMPVNVQKMIENIEFHKNGNVKKVNFKNSEAAMKMLYNITKDKNQQSEHTGRIEIKSTVITTCRICKNEITEKDFEIDDDS